MIPEILKSILIFSYGLWFLYLIRREPKTVLYAIIVYINISVLISLVLIENGLPIAEQQIFGYNNGSFVLFYIYSIISLCFFYYLSSKDHRLVHFPNVLIKQKNLFLIGFIIFGLVLLYSWIQNPNYTRFDIFNGPFKMLFVRIEYLFSFIFLYSLFRIKSVEKKLLIYLAYCFLMYFRGSQFGAFLIGTIWFFIAFYLENKRLKMKWTVLFFILVAIPVVIKISSTNLIYMGQRIVLQGHVFWGTVNVLVQNGPNPDFSGFISHYNDFFSGFQAGSIEYGFGKLMHEVSPHFAIMKLKAGVRFSAGYPAILFYHFGYIIGIIFHIGFTFLFYHLLRYLVYCFKYKDAVYSYFIYMIYLAYSDFMIQGEYANFRLKFLIKVALVLFVVFLYKNFSEQKKITPSPVS